MNDGTASQESRNRSAQTAGNRSGVLDREGLLLGPVLLAITAGLLLTTCVWERFGQRTPSAAELASYTAKGREWFAPEYDIPIYILGLAGSLAWSLAVRGQWRKRMSPRQVEHEARFTQFLMLLHYPLAAMFLVVSAYGQKGGWLRGIVGGMALFCSVAMPFVTPGCFVRLLRGPRCARRYGRRAVCLAAPAVVVLLVYIPDSARMASRCFRHDNFQHDHFHHWDFYAMAPALAFRHGAALGTESYAQYGVGWPIFFATLSSAVPLAYKNLIWVGVVWGCVYFSVLFFFLRSLLRSVSWALTGLLLAILAQLFSGTSVPLWIFPSSTVLRTPVDVLLLLACLSYARSGKTRLSVPVGILAGIGVLFSNETGLYLVAALGIFFVLLTRLPADLSGRYRLRESALTASFCGLAVLLTGLAYASRGTLLQAAFWKGWLEPIRLYGGGMGAMLIRDGLETRRAYLLFLTMLACYLAALVPVADKARRRAVQPQEALIAMVALYGLATLLLFVNRSHPYNLFHPIVPFCIVLMRFCSSAHREVLRRAPAYVPGGVRAAVRATLRLVPITCLCLVAARLYGSPNFRDYPGLLCRIAQSASNGSRTADEVCLFASREDVPLPRQEWEKDIRSFQAVVALIRELSQGGRHSLAMIAWDDTAYLAEVDLRPYFRYSPVLPCLLDRQQVQAVKSKLQNDPPEYLLVSLHPPAGDILEELQTVFRQRFAFERQTGTISVLRREP